MEEPFAPNEMGCVGTGSILVRGAPRFVIDAAANERQKAKENCISMVISSVNLAVSVILLVLLVVRASGAAPQTPPPRKFSYYDILLVQPDATEDQVRRAFRNMAKRWHPDASGKANEADVQFFALLTQGMHLTSLSNQVTYSLSSPCPCWNHYR